MFKKALITFIALCSLSLGASEPIIYGVKVSPFVRKVEAALLYKNIP